MGSVGSWIHDCLGINESGPCQFPSSKTDDGQPNNTRICGCGNVLRMQLSFCLVRCCSDIYSKFCYAELLNNKNRHFLSCPLIDIPRRPTQVAHLGMLPLLFWLLRSRKGLCLYLFLVIFVWSDVVMTYIQITYSCLILYKTKYGISIYTTYIIIIG